PIKRKVAIDSTTLFQIFTHTKSIAQSRIVSSVSPISQHHAAIFTTKNEHALTNLERRHAISGRYLRDIRDTCRGVMANTRCQHRQRVSRSLAKDDLAHTTEQKTASWLTTIPSLASTAFDAYQSYANSTSDTESHGTHLSKQAPSPPSLVSSLDEPAIFSKVGSELHLNITLIITQCTFIYLRKVYQLGSYHYLSVKGRGVERGIRSKRRNYQPDNSLHKRSCTQVY
ncbi:hypothetical protein LB507_007698, partial [Fusarium sp. FIESC RH6]